MPDFSGSSGGRAMFDERCIGIILLLIVNVLWVLSAELTRFIFVEEDFKRPFFTTYVKTCMLTVYMLRYFMTGNGVQQKRVYKVLDSDVSDCESYDIGCDILNVEGFETMTSDSENDADNLNHARTVRFAEHREVRRMPSSEAEYARQARLPYSPPVIDCKCSINIPQHVKYTIFLFAPMWFICTLTYQAALLFTSVSSLNLISSSSSLFVLLLSICLPSNGSKFTLFKALLVVTNLGGVIVVSQFSAAFMGAIFAQVSAISYAIYLTLYSRFEEKNGEININLMFGSIGILAVIIGTPLLFVLDVTGVEVLHPLPTKEQLSSMLLAALFGTLLADYLWLLAARLTDCLSASLSLTLSIPFSFLADTVLNGRPPTGLQLLAAIPITLSFIGAAVVESNWHLTGRTSSMRDDAAALLEDQE